MDIEILRLKAIGHFCYTYGGILLKSEVGFENGSKFLFQEKKGFPQRNFFSEKRECSKMPDRSVLRFVFSHFQILLLAHFNSQYIFACSSLNLKNGSSQTRGEHMPFPKGKSFMLSVAHGSSLPLHRQAGI